MGAGMGWNDGEERASRRARNATLAGAKGDGGGRGSDCGRGGCGGGGRREVRRRCGRCEVSTCTLS